MRLLVSSEEKNYGDPPMLSFHGDPIPDIQRTFLDSNKGAPSLYVPCWEALHISGFQLSFNDGTHSVTLQSTKTKKKPASWCCDELKLMCSDDQLFHLIRVTLENENGYDLSDNALANFQEDVRFLVAMYDRLFLEGSETYRPKRNREKKKNMKGKKNLIPDGIVRKFGAKDLFISIRSALGNGLTLPVKGLPTPPENTTTFESVALFLHMLSYMTEGSVERAGLTVSLAVRGRNLPPSRLTFETETSLKGNQTVVLQAQTAAEVTGEAEGSDNSRPLPSASPSDQPISSNEARNSYPKSFDSRVETKLTIYCSENLPDHVGCIPYNSRDLGTILVMAIMIVFYLLCFVGFYTDVMEKYRNMTHSANITSSLPGPININITNVTAPDVPMC